MLSRIDGTFLALDTEHGIYREPDAGLVPGLRPRGCTHFSAPIP